MNYSIIIPIYNELPTLPTLLKKLDQLDKKIEVILINDGSNDGTKSYLEKQKSFKIINNGSNIGKGASIIAGLKSAMNENIILFDGDLEVDVSEIPNLISIYENGKADVLTGIRWNKSILSFEVNSMGNQLINKIFNILYKSNLKDVLCCVKILNINLIKSLKIKSQRFGFEAEMMAKIISKNFSVSEVKIKYKRRSIQQGKKLKFSDGWFILWEIIRLKFKLN